MEHSNNVHILLVEDNANDAELALRALNKHNLTNEILWVKDGEEALEYLFRNGRYQDRSNSKRPKVIFLDLKLPKVDGLEVLKSIRSDERTKSIPVVVLTSSKEEKDLVRSYDLGVNSYIVKPIDFESFAQAISDIGYYWVVLNQQPNK